MRRPLYIANWKMNKTEGETRSWLAAAAVEQWDTGRCEAAVAPPLTSLRMARDCLAESAAPVALAAQTCHYELAGAYTGEVSPSMLADLGVRFVLAGHSERRQMFGETDERVGRKVRAIAATGMIPVLCIGETASERESGRTRMILEAQLRRGAEGMGLGPEDAVVAYEPVWAIGTGVVATTEQVAEAHAFLRTILSSAIGAEKADRVRLLYGGSVTPATVAPIAALPDVDGALIGGASLDPGRFFDLIRRGAAARNGSAER